MIASENPIDTLLDQIDQHDNIETCGKCLCAVTDLLKTSCNHTICLECSEAAINASEYKTCPICNVNLNKTIHKLFTDYLANPVNKLRYYHDINIGDMLWYYNGNGHNWLYSKEHSAQIEDAYDEYTNDTDSPSTVDIDIQIGNQVQTYVIDFKNNNQYSKKDPNKKRGVVCFKLNTLNDLKKNKIIGVAGNLL